MTDDKLKREARLWQRAGKACGRQGKGRCQEHPRLAAEAHHGSSRVFASRSKGCGGQSATPVICYLSSVICHSQFAFPSGKWLASFRLEKRRSPRYSRPE